MGYIDFVEFQKKISCLYILSARIGYINRYLVNLPCKN